MMLRDFSYGVGGILVANYWEKFFPKVEKDWPHQRVCNDKQWTSSRVPQNAVTKVNGRSESFQARVGKAA
jgi:hypothetical protein